MSRHDALALTEGQLRAIEGAAAALPPAVRSEPRNAVRAV